MTHRVRLIAAAVALATLPVVAQAQDDQFKVGSKVVNVGILVAGDALGGIGIGGGLEVGVARIADVVTLGVGGSIGYLHKSYGGYLTSVYGYNINVIPVLGFVHGHYQLKEVPKLDLFAGPAVGIARSSYSFDGDAAYYNRYFTSSTDVAIGIQAGARYELTSAIVGSLQVSGGSNLPWINAGVAFKF